MGVNLKAPPPTPEQAEEDDKTEPSPADEFIPVAEHKVRRTLQAGTTSGSSSASSVASQGSAGVGAQLATTRPNSSPALANIANRRTGTTAATNKPGAASSTTTATDAGPSSEPRPTAAAAMAAYTISGTSPATTTQLPRGVAVAAGGGGSASASGRSGVVAVGGGSAPAGQPLQQAAFPADQSQPRSTSASSSGGGPSTGVSAANSGLARTSGGATAAHQQHGGPTAISRQISPPMPSVPEEADEDDVLYTGTSGGGSMDVEDDGMMADVDEAGPTAAQSFSPPSSPPAQRGQQTDPQFIRALDTPRGARPPLPYDHGTNHPPPAILARGGAQPGVAAEVGRDEVVAEDPPQRDITSSSTSPSSSSTAETLSSGTAVLDESGHREPQGTGLTGLVGDHVSSDGREYQQDPSATDVERERTPSADSSSDGGSHPAHGQEDTLSVGAQADVFVQAQEQEQLQFPQTPTGQDPLVARQVRSHMSVPEEGRANASSTSSAGQTTLQNAVSNEALDCFRRTLSPHEIDAKPLDPSMLFAAAASADMPVPGGNSSRLARPDLPEVTDEMGQCGDSLLSTMERQTSTGSDQQEVEEEQAFGSVGHLPTPGELNRDDFWASDAARTRTSSYQQKSLRPRPPRLPDNSGQSRPKPPATPMPGGTMPFGGGARPRAAGSSSSSSTSSSSGASPVVHEQQTSAGSVPVSSASSARPVRELLPEERAQYEGSAPGFVDERPGAEADVKEHSGSNGGDVAQGASLHVEQVLQEVSAVQAPLQPALQAEPRPLNEGASITMGDPGAAEGDGLGNGALAE
ncbi:unnamed protein product [Amoebophrya sp. A120]|nr:unnamed protein product [Amoebophrya sp. A120]|eukprot:GSA120T00020289001.1